MKTIITATCALLAAGPALAHPGHGGGALHWFSDAAHVGIVVLLGMAFAPVISLRLRERFGESEDDHEG